MTVPIYQSFKEAKTGTIAVTLLEIDKPTGVVEDDLMVAVIVTDGTTYFHARQFEDWPNVQLVRTAAVSATIVYRIAGASEPSSYEFTWAGASQAYGFITRITGHDTTTPINISALDTATSAAPTCPSVTTTKDDCLILRIFAADEDDRTLDGGEPSGTTVITVDDTDDGLYGRGFYGDGYYGQTGAGFCTGGAAYESQGTSGATGTAAFALTASQEWIAVTVAIQEVSPVSASISSSPSASTSISASPSRSSSPSQTPSASISASISSSISSSPSSSISASPSKTPSASISSSPSGTPSASPSRTPSASISASPSSTISASPSATPTGSPSGSPSATPSVSGDELDTSGYGIYESNGTVQNVENTFVNLDHLEGETVTILGTDVDDTTAEYDSEIVTDSAITLMALDPHAHNFVRKAIVGIRYRYTLKPMRLDYTTAGGTTKGSIKKFSEVVVSFLNTLNAQYGEDIDNLHEFTEGWGTTLFTGDKLANSDGGFGVEDNFVISGNNPFPCTIRAIIPRVKKTGR